MIGRRNEAFEGHRCASALVVVARGVADAVVVAVVGLLVNSLDIADRFVGVVVVVCF